MAFVGLVSRATGVRLALCWALLGTSSWLSLVLGGDSTTAAAAATAAVSSSSSSSCSSTSLGGGAVEVEITKSPPRRTNVNSATFEFLVLKGSNGENCSTCSIYWRLDRETTTDCVVDQVTFTGLKDGNHTFQVCASNGPKKSGCESCDSYSWIIDTSGKTVPTASITTPTPFTRGQNATVFISFSLPCDHGTGFHCSSVNDCSLQVSGPGRVIPRTLTTLDRLLNYSVVVSLSQQAQFGVVNLGLDTAACTDSAGNPFVLVDPAEIQFDRRDLTVSLTALVPEMEVDLGTQRLAVLATNNYKDVRITLNFSHPVANTTDEIETALTVSDGSLRPILAYTHADRVFQYRMEKFSRLFQVISISLEEDNGLVSREGIPVPPVPAVSFLYDNQRPNVTLISTTDRRTTDGNIPVYIRFSEYIVSELNQTSVNVTGRGTLRRLYRMDNYTYVAYIKTNPANPSSVTRDIDGNNNHTDDDDDDIYVNVPEGVARDIVGNTNHAAQTLRIWHYPVPVIATAVAISATVYFLATSSAVGLLHVSTSALVSTGQLLAPPRLPTGSLFRMACFIQVFALSRWLSVTTPIEYYTLSKDMKWSIPYMNLPWEKPHNSPPPGSTPINHRSSLFLVPTTTTTTTNIIQLEKPGGRSRPSTLNSKDYQRLSEQLSNETSGEPRYDADPALADGWVDFERTMFWLAIIAGSLVLLHGLVLLVLKLKRGNRPDDGQYGALTFPRFEIFLFHLSIPSLCKASASIIRGGTVKGKVVGILILCIVSLLILAEFMFLVVGITLGKFLQYQEQDSQEVRQTQPVSRTTGPYRRSRRQGRMNNLPQRGSNEENAPAATTDQDHTQIDVGKIDVGQGEESESTSKDDDNEYNAQEGTTTPPSEQRQQAERIYREFIQVTLGRGEEGWWTWKSDQSNKVSNGPKYLLMYGPIFEDLRGPPTHDPQILTRPPTRTNVPTRRRRQTTNANEVGDASVTAATTKTGGGLRRPRRSSQTLRRRPRRSNVPPRLPADSGNAPSGTNKTENADAEDYARSQSLGVPSSSNVPPRQPADNGMETSGTNKTEDDTHAEAEAEAAGAGAETEAETGTEPEPEPEAGAETAGAGVETEAETGTEPEADMSSQISERPKQPADTVALSIIETDDVVEQAARAEDGETPLFQNLFESLRVYYLLLESLKLFSLGVLAGLFAHETDNSRAPPVILLCITSVQLILLVFNKPFIKRKDQLAEIQSIVPQVALFTSLVILEETEHPSNAAYSPKKSSGRYMLSFFLIGILCLAINESFALFKQVGQLDTKGNSPGVGLKIAGKGLLLFFLPEELDRNVSGDGDEAEKPEAQEDYNADPTNREEDKNIAEKKSGVDDNTNNNDPKERGRSRSLLNSSYIQGLLCIIVLTFNLRKSSPNIISLHFVEISLCSMQK